MKLIYLGLFDITAFHYRSYLIKRSSLFWGKNTPFIHLNEEGTLKKFNPIVKTVAAATMLALGSSAFAERMIVHYDKSNPGIKKGHKVLVESDGWFAVELDETGKSTMRGKKGFKFMEVDHKKYPASVWSNSPGNPNSVQVVPYNYSQVQAEQLTLQPGPKVCVIDSGIAREQGDTGGFNEDFDWSTITGDNDPGFPSTLPGTGDWFRDGGSHGTHVAGTIGAADNAIGIIGVAPGVPMHIIKVFNAEGYGYTSDLAYAVERCADAGANIVNMSLSGPSSSTEENAMNNFRDNGGLLFAAAGNDGNSVRAYPAGYSSVVMVGGVNNNDEKYTASQFPACQTTTTGRGKNRQTVIDETTCVEISGGGEEVLSTVAGGTGSIASVTADGAGISASASSNTGVVTAAGYFMGTAEATDSNANGKICVIDRGNISFVDKINNCGASGGVGAVIVNNVDGVINMDVTGVNTSIPAVSTLLADRSTLINASSITIDAPAGGDYAVFSGTSMATPTVAGVAALVWSNHPSCTGEEIRAALKAAAQDIGPAGRDNDFGYGIAKAKDTSDYLTANPCGGGTEPPPPPPPADATLSGSTSKGGRQANLTWSGLSGSTVDVYINGSFNNNTANDGAASYSITKNSSPTFQVCEAGTTTCTNSVTL